MKKNIFIIIGVILLVFPSSAATWTVDDSGGADFTTIQAAVSAATAGDEIVVGDGTYTENVDVGRQLVIRSENGSAHVTVTAASPTLPVFDVNANGIVIQGFSVRGPTNTHVAGIEIVDYNDCLVIGNDCSGCYNGIHIGGTGTNNTIESNYCHGNTERGISLRDTAHGNFVLKNTVENNTNAGFCIKDSTFDNTLWLNDVIGNRVEILTATTAHSPAPITYTYNGGTYTSRLGNYYSDYSGTDADGNGVGTPSYAFGSGGDNYPLMARSSNYVETGPAAFLWGPYLTGSSTTMTIVNLKTDIPAAATVEYATDAYYTVNSGYDKTASDGLTDTFHHIALTALEPGTLYHYRVSSGGRTTGDLHFRTFPETGAFTFVVYSDTQDQLPTFSQLERHKLVADRIADEPGIAFVLNSGDLVNNATNLSDWDRYFAAGSMMMANTTVFPALGNHDRYEPYYSEIYGVPEYYSFDCGDAHVTVLNSNSWAWPDLPSQSAWLAADLGTEKPFRFVSFHHPIYSSESKHFGGWENLRLEWEDDFNENGVLAVFNGHVHAYERLVVNDTNYFVAGIGGAPSYNLADPRYEASVNSLEYMIGYTRVRVDPAARTATAEVIRVADISSDLKTVTTVYPPDTIFETVVMALPGPPVEPHAIILSPPSPHVAEGTTCDFQLSISSLPEGLSGYDLAVTLSNPSIAEITGVQYPGWAGMNNTTPLPQTDSLRLSGVDLGRNIQAGAEDVLLATITVRADSTGTSAFVISNVNMDADGGGIITPEISSGEIVVYAPLVANFTANVTSGKASLAKPLFVQFTDLSAGDPPVSSWSWDFDNDGVVDSTLQDPVASFNRSGNYTVNLTVQNTYSSDTEVKVDYIRVTSLVKPFPGQTSEPTDPDGDGLYEDINGNGRLDYDDVVIYYDNMQWIRDQPDVGIEPYDYNGNGRIDYDDVVVLYQELLASH